jgi:hypothetical protein
MKREGNYKGNLLKEEKCLFYKHGKSNKERLYEIWKNMKKRCRDSSLKCYKNYGGKGIKVCKEWQEDYMLFRNWAYRNGYEENLYIDRINNNKNYEPNNCRWATMQEQQNNRTNNRICNINGLTASLADICRKYNVKYKKVWKRLSLGWELEEALFKN